MNFEFDIVRDVIVNRNLLVGWAAISGGVVTGTLMGLFFHRDDWLGGYQSYPRRMLRLGHIAFFGLGILNLFFAVTVDQGIVVTSVLPLASWAFILGAITMPLCCFSAAIEKEFRHLFALPVACTSTGLVCLFLGWGSF